MENIRQHLATQLEMNVSVLDSLAGLTVARKLDKTALDAAASQLSVALGLALRGGDEA